MDQTKGVMFSRLCEISSFCTALCWRTTYDAHVSPVPCICTPTDQTKGVMFSRLALWITDQGRQACPMDHGRQACPIVHGRQANIIVDE
ncbi:hypothetical protein MAR_022132, partial [Mya arenaria]